MSSNKGKMTTIADLKVQEQIDPLGKVLLNKGIKLHQTDQDNKPRLTFTTTKPSSFTTNEKSKIVLLKSTPTTAATAAVAAGTASPPATVAPTVSATVVAAAAADKKFACDFLGCGKSFDKAAMLRRHAKLHQADVDRKSTCEVCNKTFETVAKKDDHCKKVHGSGGTTGLPFSCNLCGQSFRYKGNFLKTSNLVLFF